MRGNHFFLLPERWYQQTDTEPGDYTFSLPRPMGDKREPVLDPNLTNDILRYFDLILALFVPWLIALLAFQGCVA